MAQRNPAKNIDRLREGSNVTSETDLTQWDALTDARYPLGNSIMSVDLTVADWPNPGKGVVNTSKVDDMNGSQSFLPKGSTDTYTRSWNDTPPDVSDDFSSVTLDLQKWTPFGREGGGNGGSITTGPPNNYLTIQSDGYWWGAIHSNFALTGDFDFEVYIPTPNSGAYTYVAAMQVGDAGQQPYTPSYTDKSMVRLQRNTGDLRIEAFNQVNTQAASITYPLWMRFTRTGTAGTIEKKNAIDDPWDVVFSGADSIEDRIITLEQSYEGWSGTKIAYFGDFTLNSGNAYLLSGAASIWQPWNLVKDAATVEQETTNAITTHETVTYDHLQMQTDITTLLGGSNEVIPEGTFDQYEPATSYKLGNSIMSVDMTIADWPDTGKGSVNTDRANDIFATQTFQPFGGPTIYNRRWDESPFDFSDDFTGDNGSAVDQNKWEYNSFGNLTYVNILNNQVQIHTQSAAGIRGRYNFVGNFDIEFELYTASSSSRPVFQISLSENYPDSNSIGVAYLSDSQGWATAIGGTSVPLGGTLTPTNRQWKITRVGTFIEIYWRLIGDPTWILANSGTQPVTLNGTGRPRFWNQAHIVCQMDNYVINSGIVTADSPASARWGDWQTLTTSESPASSLSRVRVVYIDDVGGNVEFDTTTTFTNISEVDVHLNGIRLLAGTEFIASTTGGNENSHIELTAPTVALDDLEIITWKVQ